MYHLLILHRGQALLAVLRYNIFNRHLANSRIEFIAIDLYHELESCGRSKQRE